jgi:asparagine synthase (glutamine-hydrolysing)
MCGIAGTFAVGEGSPPVDVAQLLRVREAMARRGPDGAGLWISPGRRAGLAHRRLSIIDLSDAGAQPMASADGRYQVVLNGEIYNYRELKAALEAKGRVFRSGSDTEVLLHLYEERGEKMLPMLRGMYAFAIWDERERRMFLARDPLGIKPLYYSLSGSTLCFASQVKALLAGGAVSDEIEPAGYAGFFLWGSVPEPYTLYRGIRALPAGHSIVADARGVAVPRPFHSLREVFAEAQSGEPRGIGVLREAVEDSVAQHLVADVPVGLFLSAGLDSAMLAASAGRHGPLRSITLGFDEYRGTENDETVLAELAARAAGTRHETRWIGFESFRGEVAGVLEAMDQPSIDGLNTWFVAAAAREAGMKVALSGLGGDELFAGYPSFRQVPRMAAMLRLARAVPLLGRAMRRVSDPLLRSFTSPKYAGFAEYGGTLAGAYLLRRALFMPWELPQLLDPDLAAEGLAELATLDRLSESIAGVTNARLAVSCLETGWYMKNQLLRDADWAGMAHSLEIRVPFADAALVARVAPLVMQPASPSKRDVAQSVWPSMPAAVLDRRKTGFTVPVREWLARVERNDESQRGLRGWARSVFSGVRRDRRALCLVADSFDGAGGIAQFSRDWLGALCADPRYREVIAFPRNAAAPASSLPLKLAYRGEPAAGLAGFVRGFLRGARKLRAHDVIVCGHLNFLPLAWLGKLLSGARLVLMIHGIDAWRPARQWLLGMLVGAVDVVVSISQFTFERFRLWAGAAPETCFLLVPCVDLGFYTAGRPPQEIARCYGVVGKKVLLTLARLDSRERYKGIDEVLEALPLLHKHFPNLAYLVAGDGTDLPRLKRRAEELGVAQRAKFIGYVDEARKRDLYRLADAFVMPGRGEGFGIVYVEAMACGVPVVGSRLDASRETLLDGELGILVDPANRDDLVRGIVAALSGPRPSQEGLARYSRPAFGRRVVELGNSLWPQWKSG